MRELRETSQESPIILAHDGQLDGQNWSIKNELTFGRDSSCDVVINDRQVSRQHARLKTISPNQFEIADLNSKNGTYINGKLITEPSLLNDGDEIKIALAQGFLFICSDSTLPLPEKMPIIASRPGRLLIDAKARIVWVGEKEISPPLSVSQFDLLYLLYSNENEVISRDRIVEAVWGQDQAIGVSEQAIDALIRRLRDRLSKIDPDHEYIFTVRGIGYIFRNSAFQE